MKPAVAAGHPTTAAAGAELLGAGGSAADAAVGASLASCVAETVMTGFLGGGHAIYWDAESRQARNLDCFCTVPSGSGGDLLELDVPFGEELVRYSVGPASCAVPGVPAGLDALWRKHGRLPWAEVCAPALRLAREGVPMPEAHAACLAMLEPVMTMGEGARIYAPTGRLLEPGAKLDQPGLVRALELVAAEGARSAYEGSIAETLLELMAERGGVVTRADLTSYRAVWGEPAEVPYAGTRFLTRAGIAPVGPALERLPALRALSEPERTLALFDALEGAPDTSSHTTNLVTVDREGSACVLTTSLGLGSGDWLPGLDLHLNSMLGEIDLIVAPLEPGARMESMMSPSVALDGGGPVLAIGAAGGTRLRTALVTAASAILAENLSPQAAVDLPRIHRAGDVVNAEPGIDEPALAALESRGLTVRRWAARHHYFGGVSLVATAGAAADPRRSGAAIQPT